MHLVILLASVMAGWSAFATGDGCGEASQTVGLLKVLAQEATDWAQRDFKGLRPGCAGALISDRLVMTAAHCQLSGINAALIQDAYGVGFRNVFIHPRYQPPTFYNNIALIELDKSIDSLEKSPICISEGADDISGMDAAYDGYGYTAEGKDSETVKKEPVTIVANDLCEDIIKANNSIRLINKAKMKTLLNKGVSNDLLCTMGKYEEDTDTYTGPCRGDSGGPLYIDHGEGNQKKVTLEGVVSGGVGACGSNQARLYTRVSAHKDWIKCIIGGVNEEKSKEDIEELCDCETLESCISVRADEIDDYGPDTIFEINFSK